MTRHAFVDDNAFILPPPKRDDAFEAHKLERLKAIYNLLHGRRPSYQYNPRPTCQYKRELGFLLGQFVRLARHFRLREEGFHYLAHYVTQEVNFFKRDPGYYAQLKHALELIYVRLEDMTLQEKALLNKQVVSQLNFIEEQIQMCGPGVFTSLNKVAQDLDQENSEEAWLEQMRQTILRNLQEEHVEQWGIGHGESIHVLNKLKQVAHQLSFGISDGEKFAEFADEWEQYALFDADAAAVNAKRMFERFNPKAIVDNLVTNYCDLFSVYRNPVAEQRYRDAKQAVGAGEAKGDEEAKAEPARATYSNLADPDNLAHFNSICKRLQESGVVYNVSEILDYSDDYTQCYLSPEFIDELPKIIKEHAARRGLIKPPCMEALKRFVADAEAQLVHAQGDALQLVTEKTTAVVAASLAELKQLFELPLVIADAEFGKVPQACLYYEQRGQAAFHIMQTLLVAYQPKMFTLTADGCEPIVRSAPLLEALRTAVELYRTEAIDCDMSQSSKSYAALQAQNKRYAEYQQCVHEKKVEQWFGRKIIAKVHRKRFLRDKRHTIKAQAVVRGWRARRQVGQLRKTAAATKALSALKVAMISDAELAKFNSWRLVFGVEQTHLSDYGEWIKLFKPLPAATLQQSYQYMLKRGAALTASVAVGADNSLHHTHYLSYRNRRTTVEYRSTDGVVADVAARFSNGEDFDWRHLRRCFRQRLLQQSYMHFLVKHWPAHLLIQSNMQVLIKSSKTFSSAEAVERGVQFAAQLAQVAPQGCLTNMHAHMLDLWLSASDEFKQQLLTVASTAEGLARLGRLLQIDKRLLDPLSLARLGGLNAIDDATLACLQALNPGALECRGVTQGHYELTARGQRVLKILMQLTPEQRERWIADINQRVERGHPCGIIADGVLAFKREYKRAARTLGGPEFFTPASLQLEISKQAAQKCLHLGKLLAARMMRADVRRAELGFWVARMSDWEGPYSQAQLREIYKFTCVLDYLARQFSCRKRIAPLRMTCKGLLASADEVCRREGIETSSSDDASIKAILHGLHLGATRATARFRLA